MDKLKGALYLKKILNSYKDGGTTLIDSMNVTNYQIARGLAYLVEQDQLSMYELSILCRFSRTCECALKLKSEDIKDEQILCLSNRDYILSELKILKTLLKDDEERNESFLRLINTNKVKLSRRNVEYDKNVLQIIPYMMIEVNNDLVLLEKKKGESRLIDTIDFPAGHCSEDTVIDSIFKELEEELGVNKKDVVKVKILRTIPSTSDPLNVSYYHLGILVSIVLNPNTTIINGESDRSNLLYLQDVLDNPDKIKNISDWCGYGILEYLNMKKI